KVWDAATGKEKLTIVRDRGRGSPASAGGLQGVKPFVTLLDPGLVYSPDGKLLSATGFGGTVKVWDVSTGRLRLNLKGHTGVVARVAFSADGKHLYSARMDGKLKGWNTTPVDEPLELKGAGGLFNRGAVAASPDGKRLAVVDHVVDWEKKQAHYQVRVLDAGTRKELRSLNIQVGAMSVGGLTFSPDG